jgi:YVTN family beta-propeller protein
MHSLLVKRVAGSLLALTALGVLSAKGSAQTSPAVIAVLCKTENTLAIVDPGTLKVLGKVPTGIEPHEIALSPDHKLAVVANYGGPQTGGNLSVIDLAARKEVRTVDLGALRKPHGLMEAGGKFYFTVEGNDAVARYDLKTDRVDWLVGTGEAGTHMLVVSPTGEKVYTANIGSSSVSVINAAAPKGPTVKRFPVGKGPEGIALSPDGRELWLGHQGGSIVIVDTATDTVKEKIETPNAYLRLLFTPDGKRVLAPESKSGALVVYDAVTRKEIGRMPIGRFPVGITLDHDAKRAYVSAVNDHKVVVVDLDKLTAAGTIEPGQSPDGIVWIEPR